MQMSRIRSPPGYSLGAIIGRGGYSVVYNARRTSDNVMFCAKIVLKAVLEQRKEESHFITEARVLSKLNHPNIVRFIDFIDYNGFYYLIMEKCVGRPLLDIINEGKRANKQQQTCKVFRQIMSALAYLHSQGYVHRDVKPENIIVDSNDNAMLIDFGFCIETSAECELCGSLHYAPPECLAANERYGTSGDMWGSGVVLYAMFVGSLPFGSEGDEREVRRICHDEVELPVWIPMLPAGLISSLLNKDPSMRPSAQDVLQHPWLKEQAKAHIKADNVILERAMKPFALDRKRRRSLSTYFTPPKCLRHFMERNLQNRRPSRDARLYAAKVFFANDNKDQSPLPKLGDDVM